MASSTADCLLYFFWTSPSHISLIGMREIFNCGWVHHIISLEFERLNGGQEGAEPRSCWSMHLQILPHIPPMNFVSKYRDRGCFWASSFIWSYKAEVCLHVNTAANQSWSLWGDLGTSAFFLLAFPQWSVFPVTQEPSPLTMNWSCYQLSSLCLYLYSVINSGAI